MIAWVKLECLLVQQNHPIQVSEVSRFLKPRRKGAGEVIECGRAVRMSKWLELEHPVIQEHHPFPVIAFSQPPISRQKGSGEVVE